VTPSRHESGMEAAIITLKFRLGVRLTGISVVSQPFKPEPDSEFDPTSERPERLGPGLVTSHESRAPEHGLRLGLSESLTQTPSLPRRRGRRGSPASTPRKASESVTVT
jgi:hypothetical protein